MNSALIFAGGVGSRMKSADVPKQFLKVDGVPIIIRTIRHFDRHRHVDRIVVVCLESWIDTLKEELEKHGIQKVEMVLPGGKTGYQSIHRGIEYIAGEQADDDIVLICDGVRPMLSEKLISTCIRDAKKFGSAVPVTQSIDSVLYSEDGEISTQNYERKKMFITQAPQGYRLGLIRDAHTKAEEMGVESVSSADLLLELGQNIHIFQGMRENIKVTTPEDLVSLRATQYYQHFRVFAEEELQTS